MVDVTVRTVYDAPRGLVARVAGDLTTGHLWQPSVKEFRFHGDPVVRTGAKVDLVSTFLGRELVYTYEVAEWVPGTRLTLRTDEGPMPIETTFAWWDEEPGPDGPRTGMSVRHAGRPRAMTTLGSGMVSLQLKRGMRRSLERLRALLDDEADLIGTEESPMTADEAERHVADAAEGD